MSCVTLSWEYCIVKYVIQWFGLVLAYINVRGCQGVGQKFLTLLVFKLRLLWIPNSYSRLIIRQTLWCGILDLLVVGWYTRRYRGKEIITYLFCAAIYVAVKTTLEKSYRRTGNTMVIKCIICSMSNPNFIIVDAGRGFPEVFKDIFTFIL